jgi:tRNA dimethylallyltransferase
MPDPIQVSPPGDPALPPILPDLVIAGPTASGKSELATALAEAAGAEIVGADAFQIYSGLPLLTAQPSPEQLQRAPHHLVGILPLEESLDVARYLQMARQKLLEIRARGNRSLLVGGTGFYIRTVLFGLPPGLPPANPDLRAELESLPLQVLQERLAQRDPEAAGQIDLQNPRRLVRALEVCIQSGRPFSSFRQTRPWRDPLPAGLWVQTPRDHLAERIQRRTLTMFDSGVESEVRQNLEKCGITAKQTLGLSEVADYLEGRLSRTQAIASIAQATRQYAKRQETWFRKETALRPVAPEDALSLGHALLQRPREGP